MTLSIDDKEQIKNILPKFRESLKLFVNSPAARGLDCYEEDKDLSCSCAISSHALGTLLERKGYSPSIIIGVYNDGKRPAEEITPDIINHCWVEVGGRIIDLTASQFNKKENDIVFIPTENSGKKFIPIIRTSVKNMKKDVIDWPTSQVPSLRNTRHILRNYQDLTGENVGA